MTRDPHPWLVEHESECPPAHVGTWLTDAGAEIEVCRPWAGDELPPASAYDALVVLGGSMGADDDAAPPLAGAAEADPARLRRRRHAGAGDLPRPPADRGRARRNRRAEPARPAGRRVRRGLAARGAARTSWWSGLGPVRGIQWNNDVVTALPDGAVALARTPQGELQVARFAPRAWGVQLHPEADEQIVVAWAEGDRRGTPRPRDRPGRPDQRDRAGPAGARRGVAAAGGPVRGARPHG